MKSKYGRGFIINITHLSAKFRQPPEQAWFGAQDFFTELTVPEQFKGTEVEELVSDLRKKVMWHQPGGPTDAEMYKSVVRVIDRLLVALDRELGIEDPDIGSYH